MKRFEFNIPPPAKKIKPPVPSNSKPRPLGTILGKPPKPKGK